MLSKGTKYTFSAKPWLYIGPSAWHFISLAPDISKEIRSALKSEEEGWGRLKATVKIGKTEWKTSIWFDTKQNAYLLPLKAEVRKKEKIEIDKMIKVTVWV
jgi:hypothetical protein